MSFGIYVQGAQSLTSTISFVFFPACVVIDENNAYIPAPVTGQLVP